MFSCKAEIRDGELLLNNELILYCRSLVNMEVHICIDTKFKRSDKQNAYYWGVVIQMLCDNLGYFPDEVHELLKMKFWGTKEIIDFEGKIKIIGNSTTTTNTKDYEIKLEMIRIWALQEFGIDIPKPNE
jgi:hypothetical protein